METILSDEQNIKWPISYEELTLAAPNMVSPKFVKKYLPDENKFYQFDVLFVVLAQTIRNSLSMFDITQANLILKEFRSKISDIALGLSSKNSSHKLEPILFAVTDKRYVTIKEAVIYEQAFFDVQEVCWINQIPVMFTESTVYNLTKPYFDFVVKLTNYRNAKSNSTRSSSSTSR